MTRHLLAAIDAAIDDWEVSDDAMRITHGEATWIDEICDGMNLYREIVDEMTGRLETAMRRAFAQALGEDVPEDPTIRMTPAAPVGPARTRRPVYRDDRPRYLTPYGPPPPRHQ